MSNFQTINTVVKSGIISGGLLRRMVRENRCPGVYSGTRFYVNVPLLEQQLLDDSRACGTIGNADQDTDN